MQDLTAEGRRVVTEVAERHGLGPDAVETLLRAVAAGQGTQAQFNHPDLGGMGQWSQGGMVMIGDMFNHGLKQTVDAACSDLAGRLGSATLFAPSHRSGASQMQSQGGGGVSFAVQGGFGGGQWWPEELGTPASTGSQNGLRYAWFPGTRRLAIEYGGRLELFDTGDHQITGTGQQQGGGSSFTFTSQHGLVRVADLPRVSLTGEGAPPPAAPPQQEPPRQPEPRRAQEPRQSAPPPGGGGGDGDIFAKIERLADLRQKGIITEQEFEAKKAELLGRL